MTQTLVVVQGGKVNQIKKLMNVPGLIMAHRVDFISQKEHFKMIFFYKWGI